MSVIIWHNPSCSKSRATLALLRERGIAPAIPLYLKDPPAPAEIRQALKLLGLPALGLIRTGEAGFRSADLSAASPEDALIAAMAASPALIERPVVFANGRARLGRPPEAVLEILWLEGQGSAPS